MADLKQRLEQHAAAYSLLGEKDLPALLREAAAALRAAPEVTDEMVEAAHAAYWAHPDDSGEDRPCIRAALEAALATRPQGVKDV